MHEVTDDTLDLHDRALTWAEREEAVRNHLKINRAPAWAVPYRLHPSYNSYGFGAAILGRASRTCPSLEREEAWERAMRLAIEIGRNALGRDSWADGYVGTPLLAANVVARSFVFHLRENLGYGHVAFTDDLESYIATLWPEPSRARPPRDLGRALGLHRTLQEFGVYEQVPGLRELVAAGSNTAESQYSARVGHLLLQVVRDQSPTRQELHGQLLEKVLTSGRTGR